MPHSVRNLSQAARSDKQHLSTRYWNVNQREEDWTEHCPDYLLGQSEKSIQILSTRNEDFQRLSWVQVQNLVQSNRIDLFQRCPNDLRGYREYTYHLKKTHGSVLSFVKQERLRWNDIVPSGDRAFSNPADFKILFNDWPYFLDQDITHLVVWTKFLIDEDEKTGEVTAEAKAVIEEFIAKTFCACDNDLDPRFRRMARDQITWFKNWKSLKSVHELEHFHIMLYKAPAALLAAVTNNDRPAREIRIAKSSRSPFSKL